MQFGRFHSMVLIALGALLLTLQAYMIFASGANTPRPRPDETSTTESKAPVSTGHMFIYLPGVVGLAMVGLGAYGVAQRQREIIAHADAKEELARHSAPNYGRR